MAYNSLDIEKFCSYFHSDILVKRLQDQVVLLEGMDSFKESYRKLFLKYPSQLCELKSRIVLNEFVLDEEMIFGREEFPDGKHVVAIYGFRNELIDRVWFAN